MADKERNPNEEIAGVNDEEIRGRADDESDEEFEDAEDAEDVEEEDEEEEEGM